VATGCSSDSSDSGQVESTSSATPTTSTAGPPSTATATGTGCETDPATISARATHERVDLTAAGADRWYARYVPASYDGSPVALVVDLHGYQSGSSLHTTLTGLGAVADEAGFVVVTPQGTSDQPFWNAVPHADLPDDVAFVEAVIDDVSETVCVDPARVYVDGFSNGAFLASLVACRSADRIAAVATVAGLLLPEDCEPSRAVPILAIHGTEDRFVSISGPPNPALAELTWNEQSARAFDGLAFGDVRDAASGWAALQGCDTQPTRVEVSEHIDRAGYDGCDDGSVVQLYVVDGAGHTWPASAFAEASASILGPATDEMDASQVIWSFFEDQRLPSTP
jgi:polyhydroxybutyrate depolymerase